MTGKFLYISALIVAASAQVPKEFEVASVKPQAPDDTRVGIQPSPGGFAARGVPLRLLIEIAYRLRDFQVSGGPGWMDADRYDVVARAPQGFNPTHEQLIPMLQALLADRFALKVHFEMRDLPAFALVTGRGGPKMPAANGKESGPQISVGHGVLTGQGIDMAGLADALGMQSGRAVVNRTGLGGNFDVTLKWNPDIAPQDPSAVPLVTAIQEQLGLRLESVKAPVKVLVIDSVRKASEN